jgi:ribonucleoside-diphosphate reductase beta chain
MTDGIARDGAGQRTSFGALRRGGLDWDYLPMRLFVQGQDRFWRANDIDFTQDAEDWAGLTGVEREAALYLCASFIAGEEAVTEDIQPFMRAMGAEGRFEDEMYLTQFAFEEAKHVEVFRRWLDAVGVTDDLHELLEPNEGYRRIFYEELPKALGALHDDASPENQLRASLTYNHVVEGTLALTGYHAWNAVCTTHGILPGMVELVRLIGRDERRHMAWGTFTCRRHVAADPSRWQLVEARMQELLEPALQLVAYPFSLFEEGLTPFGLEMDEFVTYATDRATRRLGAIQQAVGRDLADIEHDMTPERLEEQFAAEDRGQIHPG